MELRYHRYNIVQCAFREMKNISELVEYTKNRNRHPANQVEKLAKLIDYQGWRHPIIVSSLSGKVIAGHARLAAAKLIGAIQAVPVDYQEFENEEQEYAFCISDNSIQEFSELDLSAINTDIIDLGPDFDLDLLSLKDFTVDLTDKFEPLDVGEDEGERSQFILQIALPNELELRDLYDDLVSKGYAVREVKK